MTGGEIVDADISHAEAIATLEHRYIDCAWTTEQVRAEAEKSNVIFLVALFDGKVVGYVSGEIAADEIELGNIAVDGKYRRRGIAKELLTEFIARARQKKIVRIFLLVAAENTAAKALYRAIGFTERGLRKSYYGKSDAVIMEIDV